MWRRLCVLELAPYANEVIRLIWNGISEKTVPLDLKPSLSIDLSVST